MIQLSVIVILLAVYLHDMFGGALLWGEISPRAAAACSLAPFLALDLAVWVGMGRYVRRIDRTGSMNAVLAAEGVAHSGRVAATILHVVAVFVFGWVDAVRSVIGNVVVIDEIVIILPAMLSWAWMWWSVEPVERRLREAAIFRVLHTGGAVHPIPTRAQFVWHNIRVHVLLILAPMLVLLAWSEAIDRLAARMGWAHIPRPGANPGVDLPAVSAASEYWVTAVQLAGVAAVFVLMPLVLRAIWDTVPLRNGELRDRLIGLCRASRVRIGELLVWRTRGLMLNGAVIGLLWPLRYILLTDALLEALDQDQIEAVTAHEIAHVRKHHMPWLGAAMLATVMLSGIPLAFLSHAMANLAPSLAVAASTIDAAAALGSLAAALVVFGFVSRRFEWQADAYAVAAVTRAWDGPEASRVSPRAISAMVGALQTVAVANGVSPRRFTWRHGSISYRQERLQVLAGRRIDRMAIDGQVRVIKVVTACLLCTAIVLMSLGMLVLEA